MNAVFLVAEALGITSFVVGFQITKLPQPDSSIIKAGEWLEKAEAAYGAGSPQTVPFLYDLGQKIITHQKNYRVAMEYMERAYTIRSRQGAPESLEMAEAMLRTGECALFSGDLSKAEERISKALAIRRPALGDDHPMTGQCWAARAMLEIIAAQPGTQPLMLRSMLSVNPAVPAALPPQAREAAEKTIACVNRARAQVWGETGSPETAFNYEAARTAFSNCDPQYDALMDGLSALKGGGPGGAAGQKCFIATAVYGSADCPQVVSFRRFRDSRLLPTAPGRALVSLYSAVGPAAAKAVEGRAFFRKIIRLFLDPLAACLEKRGGV